MNHFSSFTKLVIAICLVLSANQGLARSCDQLSVNGGQNWYPFFDHHNPGRYGIIGDIVYEAANRSGVSLKLAAPSSWKRVLFDLKSGRLDIVAGALKTEERQKAFQFSVPVYHTQLNVFVKKEPNFQFTGKEDLRGMRGVLIRGMSIGESFDNYALSNLIIEETTNTSSLFRMIYAGRVNYGIFYLHSGQNELQRINLTGKIVPLSPPISQEPIYIAFSKSSLCTQRIAKINEEIEKMKNDGSIDRIISRYPPHTITQTGAKP